MAALAAATCSGFGGIAHAQTQSGASTTVQTAPPVSTPDPVATSSDQAASTNDGPSPIAGDIVVTANRRAESLQRVPVAVTALSNAELRINNLVGTQDLVRLTPTLGFTQAQSSRTSSFYIRGVGTFSTTEGFDTSVGVAIDGIPAGRNSTAFQDLVDIERVEVLEGPQGMLFGKNASAGLINIINNKPVLDETSVAGHLSYGNYNQVQANAVVNYAPSDTVAVRGTAWNYSHDGYISAPFENRKLGKQNHWGGRLGVRLAPTDNLEILLTGQYTKNNDDPFIPTDRGFINNAAGVQAFELAEGLVPGPNNRRDDVIAPLRYNTNDQTYSAVVNYKVGGVTLTSTSSYERYSLQDAHDAVATNSPTQVIQSETQRVNQFSQELRITSPTDTRLKYVAGLFYFNLHDNSGSDVVYNNFYPIKATSDSNTGFKSSSYAVFGQATYDVLADLRLIAGGRYSHDDVSGTLVRTVPAGQIIVNGINGVGQALGVINAASQISDDEGSWRVGLQYDVTKLVMAYATVSHGYKAAGLDLGANTTAAQIAINGAHVAPETSTNYEAGVRSELFGRRLTLNATAFREVFTNFQVATVILGPPTTSITQNAPQMTSTGATVQASAHLSRSFSLSSNIAYVDAKFTNFPDAACYPGEPTQPTGTTPGFCVGGAQSDKGVTLPNAPKWTLVTAADYQHSLTPSTTIFGNANYRYQSGVEYDINNNPQERQSGYSLVNFAVGVRSSDNGRWSVRAYVDNAFNKQFVNKIVQGGVAYLNINSFQSVRTFGLALDLKIGR